MIAQDLSARLDAARHATATPPLCPRNPFFGVGPITDMAEGPDGARDLRAAFEAWVTATYRKRTDTGADIGGFTVAELSRSMHRGTPGDEILRDCAAAIHGYFGLPETSWLAMGVGGGHSGFTAAAFNFVDLHDPDQGIFIDTARPEDAPGGFFRQLWGTQLIEMMRLAEGGAERLSFAEEEGSIPPPEVLEARGIRLFFGVGHETAGATTYSATDLMNLFEWIDRDPANRHAVIDATSLLGAMPWPAALIEGLNRRACLFMPFQKAIGGPAGYHAVSLTPHARAHIDTIQKNPGLPVPRQFRFAVPIDPARPLSSARLVAAGPSYDPARGAMVGGIINTFSVTAFAETIFALKRMEAEVGDVFALNRRSVANRQAVADWVAAEPLFERAVEDPARQGCAVTLIRVVDPDIEDRAVHDQIVAKSKGLLGYEGLTRADGTHMPGLDAARYVNAFPGTPGDYRAWIGGIRPTDDITRLLDCIRYCYLCAKIAVLEDAAG